MDPPVKIRVIISRVVPVHAYWAIESLTGKFVGGGRRAVVVPNRSPGIIAQLGDLRASDVRGDAGRAKVISKEVKQVDGRVGGWPGAHGNTGCASVVVLHHRVGAAFPLEIVANVNGGDACLDAFDPVAIAIIKKDCSGCATHSGHAVFGVVSQVVGASDIAGDHVAVAIVRICARSGCRYGMRDSAVPRRAAHRGVVCQA